MALPTFFPRKKQTTRLIKCSCSACGYTARTSRKWLDTAGAPICPTDKKAMVCDDGSDPE